MGSGGGWSDSVAPGLQCHRNDNVIFILTYVFDFLISLMHVTMQ
jgi:hypothetical protein